jgi:hypothetical protein
MIDLLEEGAVPFVQIGTHQYVPFADLLEYKQRRDEERLQGIAEIAHMCEDEGLYD